MDYKEAYDAMAVVMGTDQTAQGETRKPMMYPPREWECVTCKEAKRPTRFWKDKDADDAERHRKINHDVRRVEGKA